jgi:hypothetical protein
MCDLSVLDVIDSRWVRKTGIMITAIDYNTHYYADVARQAEASQTHSKAIAPSFIPVS